MTLPLKACSSVRGTIGESPPVGWFGDDPGNRRAVFAFSDVMRRVKIVERPNETYPFAAIDQATGEVPLQLADRAALVAICGRLGWTIQDGSEPNGIALAEDSPQPISERHRARRPAKRVRHRLGGATKYTSARKRRRAVRWDRPQGGADLEERESESPVTGLGAAITGIRYCRATPWRLGATTLNRPKMTSK